MLRTRLLLVLFVLTACGGCLSQLFPQQPPSRRPQPARLRIMVTYDDGQTRVRDAMVELQDAVGGSSAMDQKLTDQDGLVEFNTITGTHRIRITGSTIHPYEGELEITLAENYHQENIRVRRKTGDQASSPEGRGTTSAIRLKIPGKAREQYEKGKQILEGCSMGAAASNGGNYTPSAAGAGSGGGQLDSAGSGSSSSEAFGTASPSASPGVPACGASEWEASRKHFQAAIDLYPDYDMAYNELGAVCWQLRDAAGARAAFVKATQLNEQFAGAQRNLARILLGERSYEELAAHLNLSLKVEPTNAWALAYAAYAELQLRRFQEALDHAQRVHDLPHEKLTWVHMVAGYALEGLGHKQKATEEFKLYLKEDPKGADVKRAQEALARLNSPPRS